MIKLELKWILLVWVVLTVSSCLGVKEDSDDQGKVGVGATMSEEMPRNSHDGQDEVLDESPDGAPTDIPTEE